MAELITEYILPVRIFEKSENVYGEDALLKAKYKQIGLSETELCHVKGKGHLVLDFGKEYHGGARILTFKVAGGNGANVRLRFGESVTETRAELGERGACNDHSLRDIVTQLVSYSDMTFAQTGFRFLRIDFLDDADVYLKNVYCAFTHREFPAAKPFDSGDERINEIFATAKRTIDMCCQQYIWDGIKRDRLVWIGDMHPETLALTALYGRCKIIEDSLDFATSQTPLGKWMNGMPMYSVWWLIIMADYCKLAGAEDYVLKYKDYISGLLTQIDGCVKDDGELDFPAYFVDWPTHEQPDELAGCRAILIYMANKMPELCRVTGISDGVALSLKNKLLKRPITVTHAKQVAALKYLALGELPEEDVALILKGGAAGVSTFMSYYILKAVAENASAEQAIEIMREYYGAMLDKGATTFFEDFDMEWVENSCRLDEYPKPGQRDIHGDFGKYCYKGFRHSFCHGWSAGVIRFLYEYANKL